MPEEIEVPTEHLHETLHEAAHKSAHGGGGHGAGDPWTLQVALSSALLAVLAAVAALMAGHHANEALIEQIHSSDHWAHYQAKSIKANMLDSKRELLSAMGKEGKAADEEKAAEYRQDQKEIEASARELEKSAADHLSRHQALARTVTLLQIAIALSAISALTRRRILWFIGLGLGAVGVVFFVVALS